MAIFVALVIFTIMFACFFTAIGMFLAACLVFPVDTSGRTSPPNKDIWGAAGELPSRYPNKNIWG